MDKPKRRWGDRSDAYLVRDIDGLHAIMPHLMDKRTDAEVYVNYEFDVTETLRYLEELEVPEGCERPRFFHCVLMAVARTIDMRPLLNRYIAGRRYYQRHAISMAFVARRRFTDEAEEKLIIIEAEEDWTLEKVCNGTTGTVDKARTDDKYGMDGTLDMLAKIPRPLLMVVARIVKIMDFFGRAPRAITDGDPNFATVLLTNLGSIKAPSVYHHLNNYGTNSIVAAIGTIHKREVIGADGSRCIRDVVEVGLTLDERIADGFYFGRSLKLIQHLLSNPELLSLPLKESIDFEF